MKFNVWIKWLFVYFNVIIFGGLMMMDLVFYLECCYNIFFFVFFFIIVFNKWIGNYFYCSYCDMYYFISCNMLIRILVVSFLINDEWVRWVFKVVFSLKIVLSECVCYYYYRIWMMDFL